MDCGHRHELWVSKRPDGKSIVIVVHQGDIEKYPKDWEKLNSLLVEPLTKIGEYDDHAFYSPITKQAEEDDFFGVGQVLNELFGLGLAAITPKDPTDDDLQDLMKKVTQRQRHGHA
jgi:hypothetical protein